MPAKSDLYLSRDELALLKYYRELPPEKQLDVLETVEYAANDRRRMQELAGRLVETGLTADGWGHA